MTSTFTIADIDRILSVLDVTLLNSKTTEKDVEKLCEKLKETPVASLCVMPQWVKKAKESLKDTNVTVSAALNFPDGSKSSEDVVDDAVQAVKNGATELDVVVPYDALPYDDGFAIKCLMNDLTQSCPGIVIKAILETGKMKDDKTIRKAAGAAAMGGADFIKTSTGFYEVGATRESVKTLTEFLNIYPGKLGLKVSGGIKDIQTAIDYYDQVEEILGLHWANKKRFRIGSSSLYNNLLIARENAPEEEPEYI